VRALAYLRVPTGASDSDSIYGQRESVRAWARRTGATILATFEDAEDDDRPGLRALMRTLSDEVDAVAVAHLGALSQDTVVQEIMIDAIRRTGAGVVSAAPADQRQLEHAGTEATRQVVRTVLQRRRAVESILGVEPVAEAPEPDLILEIVDDPSNLRAG
jgi:DNA invertase Pin-like site-specific DNA recombinase